MKFKGKGVICEAVVGERMLVSPSCKTRQPDVPSAVRTILTEYADWLLPKMRCLVSCTAVFLSLHRERGRVLALIMFSLLGGKCSERSSQLVFCRACCSALYCGCSRLEHKATREENNPGAMYNALSHWPRALLSPQ